MKVTNPTSDKRLLVSMVQMGAMAHPSQTNSPRRNNVLLAALLLISNLDTILFGREIMKSELLGVFYF